MHMSYEEGQLSWMSFKVKDKFSSQTSDHQTVNLFQNARTVEQCKERWHKSSEQVPQKEHLPESLKPILNNLSFVDKIKFNMLYWNDQTHVSLAILYGKNKRKKFYTTFR